MARYDREVAAALFQPMDACLRSLAGQEGPQNRFNALAIVAKGRIDLLAAVELAEALTPPREFSRNQPAHSAGLRLAEMLGLPADKRWKRLWSSMRIQLPIDD